MARNPFRSETVFRCLPARLMPAVAVWLACVGEVALAADGAADPVIAPLPSSALMGGILLGGLAAFARFPSHKKAHRRRRPA